MRICQSKKIVATVLAAALSSCADVPATAVEKSNHNPNLIKDWKVKTVLEGKASWYSVKTNGGTKTASGEIFQNHANTAAHKTLPLGTHVRVTNVTNGKSEILRITDRGPHCRGRMIDVTVGCAQRLGFYSRGIAPVRVEVLQPSSPLNEAPLRNVLD